MKRRKQVEHVYPVGEGGAVSVREAKAHFSALMGRVAEGGSVTITWHGQPRARLVPVADRAEPFRVDRGWLARMTVRAGAATPAENAIRADRDARG